jgi:predicted phage-related endonuclease
MEQNHKQLHDVLKITPDQEIVWKKLTESEHSMTRVAHESAEDLAKLTTPERGEKRLEHMKAEQAQMAEHVAAIKAFYAALTPEQKTTFDDFHSAPRDAKRVKPELPAKASQKL